MKPLLAITVGDCNGIGPEVALKAASSLRVRRACSILLIGPELVFRDVRRSLRIPLRFFVTGADPEREELQTVFPLVPLLPSSTITRDEYHPGTPHPSGGAAAIAALRAAVALAARNTVDGIVTAPLAKHLVREPALEFRGHTEFLQQLTGAPDVAMMLVCRSLKVGLATIHEPLRAVPSVITGGLLLRRARIVLGALRNNWGIPRPRMAFLGLNPHAGENGLLGDEERDVIAPAVATLRNEGEHCEGPFAADAFFARYRPGTWDAVFAMYHDQGLIPLKMSARGRGVNVTAGLPLIRTSPDHGTAFDLAGKGIADPSSMEEAILLAATMVRNRRKPERRRKQ
jgi:4-hydroxythreonine-4-phosphate dehydrogenase